MSAHPMYLVDGWPDDPMYLVDGWPDGTIEEHAWVEVTTRTASATEAVAFLEKEMPTEDISFDDTEYRYIACGGKEWLRPQGYAIPGDSDVRSERPLTEYGPCPMCGGQGHYQVIDKILPTTEDRRFERFIGCAWTPMRQAQVGRFGGFIAESYQDTCDDCYGTGRNGDFISGDEGFPWDQCAEGDSDALLFWRIEVEEVAAVAES